MTLETGEQKTSRYQSVSLDQWQEITGEIIEINASRDQVALDLSVNGSKRKLSYPASSEEAKILRTLLSDEVGSIVSVLRTDSTSHPLNVNLQQGAE